VIQFNEPGNIDPAGMNFTVRQVSDGRVLQANVPYEPGTEINFGGISVRIEGRPAPGDAFRVDSTQQKGLLEGLEDFIADLRRLSDNSADRVQLSASIANTIDNMAKAQDQLLKTRSAVGARLNQAEAARAANDDFELVVRTALSELSDLDYAKAISQLTQETFVLEAAQASFTKITRLSLFNLI